MTLAGCRRPVVTVAAVLTAALLGGCGDADLLRAQDTAASAVTSDGCTSPAANGTLPDGWPDLPLLPPDVVVTGVQARSGSRTVAGGVVPRPFDEVLRTLRTAYEQAGLTLTDGEVEPRDAESGFRGRGVEGRWGLREVPGCPSRTTISVVIRPTS